MANERLSKLMLNLHEFAGNGKAGCALVRMASKLAVEQYRDRTKHWSLYRLRELKSQLAEEEVNDAERKSLAPRIERYL